MNRGRLLKLERAVFPKKPGREAKREAERAAVALLHCITPAELEAIAGHKLDDHPRARNALSRMSDGELAAVIFNGDPELLAVCRARLAAQAGKDPAAVASGT